MYRVRFHGRGGQGLKTASRILGSAFFLEGFEVQDAPRYGAERRGAPIFAYVRASRTPIRERGIIALPDLVAVTDETLIRVAAAGVTTGLDAHATLLLATTETADIWSERLRRPGRVLTLPTEATAASLHGVQLAGAAARLVGVISRTSLERAVQDEVGPLGRTAVDRSLEAAVCGFEAMAEHEGSIQPVDENERRAVATPDWVEVPFDDASVSAPAIHAGLTSRLSPTGLWRTARPVVRQSDCHRCAWICSTLCPDNAITVDAAGYPVIDLEHCKGCMICVAQCPFHVIEAVPEPAPERTAEGSS